MSAKKQSRKTGKRRARAGKARKKLTAPTKGTRSRRTATKPPRARSAKRKGAKAPAVPVRARAPHDAMLGAGPEAAPVDVVEVTTVEVVAMRDPFARP